MWQRHQHFTLEIDLTNEKEKVSSLYYNKGLYLGREDGKVSFYGEKKLYEFQGFDLEFDYLESCDVLEKIMAIEKMTDGGLNDILIIGNERNIKLWKVRNVGPTYELMEGIHGDEYNTTCIKECKNSHSYVLNSLSLNNDNQYLISSDYLKINLWKPEKMDSCYTVVDAKPGKYSDLVYVINSSKFNPDLNTVFGYSTSSGEIHLNDLRLSSKSSEILVIDGSELDEVEGGVKSISDFNFFNSNFIITRNLNSVSFYDIRNPKSDVFTTTLCENTNEIGEIYESEAVYARFKIACNKNKAFTGCFNNKICIVDLINGSKDIVTIIPEVIYDEEKDKLKFITAYDDKFAIAYDGVLVEYKDVK